MFRDFSESAKVKLLEYVADVTETTMWGKIGDAIGDVGNNVLDWFGWLNINRFVDDLDGYHKKIIDKNNTTRKQIEDIFSSVNKIDERYSEGLEGENGIVNAICKLMNDLSEVINPSGGNLEVNKFSAVLAADVEKLQESKVAKQSVAENKMLGTNPEGASTSVDPVNLSTGNFIYEHSDLTNDGEIELVVHRYYNSKDSKILNLGKGFRHNYDIVLIPDSENKVEIILSDGQHKYFEKEEGIYQNVNGISESLENIGEQYVYINEERKKHYFNTKGNLLRIENSNKRGISFEYNESNKLMKAITDNGNYLTYSYGDNGYISKVCDTIGREVAFKYIDNLLVKVKLPEHTEISYSYADNGRIKSVINSKNGVAVANEYDNQFRVTKQRFLDNGEMRFIYDDVEKYVTQIERNGARTVFVHDELFRNIETRYHDGSTENFLYNDRNQCISKTDRNNHVTRISYDNRGNVAQILDPKKKKSNFTYDGQNHLLSVSINGKIRLKNTYDNNGNLILTKDALGNKTCYKYNQRGQKIYEYNVNGEYSYEYDDNGNVSEIYQGDILINRYEHDTLNRVILEVDTHGNQTKYEYDDLDRIKRIVNSNGKIKEMFYDSSNHKPIKIVDFDGHVIENVYDELGRIISETDKNGNVTKYTYDVMWNISSITEPNGAVVYYEYNLDNRLSRIIFPNSGEVLYEYDNVGNRTMIKDADENITRFMYNKDNTLKAVLEANGAETSFEYDYDGNLILVRDALNNTVSMEYDIMGNKTAYVDEEGNKTSMEYTDYGRLKQIIYPTGGISKYEYDNNGNMILFKDETGREEKLIYDVYGNVTQKIINGETTTFEYNTYNRIVKVNNSVGGIREYKYDMFGNITNIIDENHILTEYQYNPDGSLKSVLEQDLIETLYKYDTMGNLVQIQKGGKNVESQNTYFEWDMMGNLIKTINPLGNTEEYLYSKARKVISKTDAEGYVTSYKYNVVGDIEEIVYGDKRTARFEYNLLKQLECVQDWNGKTLFELNKLGMPLKVSDHNGKVIQYEWGSRNEKRKVTYPDGTECSYVYNKSNQLVEVGIGQCVTKYIYDEYGRFVSRTNNEGVKTQYEYNNLGRISRIINSISDNIIEEYNYQFDAFGNKIKTSFIGNSVNESLEYGYDKVGRLSSVSKNEREICTYQYDIFSNRIRKNDIASNVVTEYFYNADNQLLREVCGETTIEYQYDRRGNLNEVNRPEEKVIYNFDSTNHLQEVRKFNSESKSYKEYEYSVLGARVEEKYHNAGQDVQTTYLIDFTRKCQNVLGKQVNNVGQTVRSQYYYDGKVMSMTNDKKELNYLLSDDHGSCTARVVGNKTYQKQYNEFGEVLNDEDFLCEFGYTGYLYDDYAECYYAHARMYNPRYGRFIGKDKFRGIIVLPQTLNRYTYCCNRPEDYEDDDGELLSIVIGAAVGGLVSGAVSVGSQVIKGVKSGKSIGESFKSVNYKEVAIEAAKGAIKGVIGGTGIIGAAIDAGVDMVGNVAEQTIVEGKSLQEVDKSEVVATGIFSFGFGMLIDGASKAIKGKITKKLGINTDKSNLKGREVAVNTVKARLNRAKARTYINKLKGRLANGISKYWNTAAKYTLNEAVEGVYGMVQSAVYKKKLEEWTTGGIDEFYHCTLAA